MTTANLIETRQATHGDPARNLSRIQIIKGMFRNGTNWNKLDPVHAECLEMFACKLGRILEGDPNCPDHWADICGYAEIGRRACYENCQGNVTEPAPLQLHVGGRYVNRKGEVVEIVKHEPKDIQAWLDQGGWWYTDRGKVGLGVEDHPHDLIAPAPALPHGLPPLPDGAVYLGQGGEFKVPEPGRFDGWICLGRRLVRSVYLCGDSVDCHYAAPADSEVARLNGKGGAQ